MHLISPEAQDVTIEGRRFHFDAGEPAYGKLLQVHAGLFAALADSAGFDCRGQWTDPRGLFSVNYLQRR